MRGQPRPQRRSHGGRANAGREVIVTPGISLYEFIPYGAPDLHASARRNMSRAMALSSGLMATLFFACLFILPRLGEPDVVEIPFPRSEWVVDLDEPLVHEPPPLVPFTPPAAPAAKVADGIATPVPDQTADPDVTIPSRGAADRIPLEHGGGGGSGAIARPAAPPEAWPEPEAYVYVEELPNPVIEVPPVYPELAREARVEGTVLARLLVGGDGRVLDVRIEPGHSIPLLDAAAEEAARRWVFTPALANGRAVMVWVAVPFRFRLQ